MSSVLFHIQDLVAFITLNRPDKYNAFNREMALSVHEKLEECDNNENIRCVLITGSGKAFSSGQDLTEITAKDAPDIKIILGEHYNPIIKKIRNLKKPVIAAVNGVAAGAGANIALSCDLVLAARSATFIQAFSKIGLVPDSGGTFFLPRLIGWQKSLALAMLGDKVKAEEAERMGMIYKIFEDEVFLNECVSLAKKLANMPTTALSLIKQAFNHSLSNNLDQQLELEIKYQELAFHTNDHKEGVASFLEKRDPVFKGN